MAETVILSVLAALSVLAGALSLMALRAADPLELRRMAAELRHTTRSLEDEIKHLKEVELVALEARCEALLERAETRFESAEHKRKSVAAREQRRGGTDPSNGGAMAWQDETLTRSERIAALERYAREQGRG